MKKILLLGGGGHCASVADSLLKLKVYDEVGVIVNESVDPLFGKIPILGTDADLEKLYEAGFHNAFITVGSIGNISLREKLYSKVKGLNFNLPNIIDPSANVSQTVVLGEGIYIGKNAVVNARTNIGTGCIINTGAIVEHDCNLSPFVHVSPGAILCGQVMIGYGTHIGAGAMVKQGICIGKNSMIGMGSIVLKDVEDHTTVYGSKMIERGTKSECI